MAFQLDTPSEHPRSRRRSVQALAGGATAVVCAAAVAACGGSSSSPKTTTDPVSSSHPNTGATVTIAAKSGTSGGSLSKHPAPTTKRTNGNRSQPTSGGGSIAHKSGPVGGRKSDEGAPAPPEPNPCRLVNLAEAQSITGGLVAGRLEAPLGPTCIYRLTHSKAAITLAVESMKFSQITHQMSARTPVTVGGRRAYCGKLGAQMLFVPLANGKLLNVTAPCSIAQQFAARALSRLAA